MIFLLPPVPLFWPRFLVAASIISILSACGTPGGAPVVSRGHVPLKSLERAGYYMVKPGDTLYAVAWKAGIDYKEIAKWNHILYPYTIYPDQSLRLHPITTSAQKKGSATFKTGKPFKQQKTANTSQKAKKPSTKPSTKQKSVAKGIKPQISLDLARDLTWQWPTAGTVVQRFSGHDPNRKGLKIRGRIGQSVRAAESGQVVYSGNGLIGYGSLIIIKHDRRYLSAYGYNRKLLVAEGDKVTKGERISEMGKTTDGKPVLHFEIRRGGKPVNPIMLLPKQQ